MSDPYVTISQLISILRRALDEYGDLPVYTESDDVPGEGELWNDEVVVRDYSPGTNYDPRTWGSYDSDPLPKRLVIGAC
jgi:hypothetical protein